MYLMSRAYFKTPGIVDFGLSIADYVVGQSAIRNPQFAICVVLKCALGSRLLSQLHGIVLRRFMGDHLLEQRDGLSVAALLEHVPRVGE